MSHPKRYTAKDFQTRLSWSEIDQDYLRQLVSLAKIEDLAGAGLTNRPERLGDVTTALMPENTKGSAQLTAREPMVVCGLDLIPIIFKVYSSNPIDEASCQFTPLVQDGQSLSAGSSIGQISGPADSLLQAERVLLNFLQHLSGIATLSAKYVTALGDSQTTLLDTRKTLPGYRVLQKYAFACGGGTNHRMGLFDRMMLKDNHLAVAGAVGGNRLTETVSLARSTCSDIPVEVEVDSIEQIQPVLDAGADIILLDNFSIEELKTAIELIGDQACTEASGGIQIETLSKLGALGLDFISTGAPIHQSTWKDIGLDWL